MFAVWTRPFLIDPLRHSARTTGKSLTAGKSLATVATKYLVIILG